MRTRLLIAFALAVVALLGADAAAVRFVFISVDPLRDTPERLANYVAAFHPDFLGATGADATCAPSRAITACSISAWTTTTT